MAPKAHVLVLARLRAPRPYPIY